MPDPPRKSAGAETTFPRDLYQQEELEAALDPLVDDVWGWRERSGICGRTVTVKVKYADFEQITRSRTLPQTIASKGEFAEVGRDLVASVGARPARQAVIRGRVTRSWLTEQRPPGSPSPKGGPRNRRRRMPAG